MFGEEAEELRLETAVVDDLLFPLALEAVLDGITALEVSRIDVAADSERVLLAQPALGRGAQSMRQQVPIAVPEHDIRDDLLVSGVVLDLGPRHEEMPLTDHRLRPVELIADEAVPRAIREDVLALDAQHLLRQSQHHAGA